MVFYKQSYQTTGFLEAGVFIGQFNIIAFNGFDILFSASLYGDNVEAISDGAICVLNVASNEIDIVARLGDDMVGAEDGYVYYDNGLTRNSG